MIKTNEEFEKKVNKIFLDSIEDKFYDLENHLREIKQLFLDLIGENEPNEDFEQNYLRDSKRARNTFRAELKQIVSGCKE